MVVAGPTSATRKGKCRVNEVPSWLAVIKIGEFNINHEIILPIMPRYRGV